MRLAAARMLVLGALFLLALPLAGRAAVPSASCPDVLVGDSLAVGMGPYARAAGFEVLARTGIGLNWLRAQNPRCARRVVVVIGTNDLRGIDPWSAEAYPERLAAIMSRWQAQQIIWATPGCFPHDESLERGSEALDRALAREPLVRVGSGRGYMRIHSGRPARCSYLSGDGIHPSGAGYRAWWANLSQAIGPAPEEEPYFEARPYREARLRPPVNLVQHARLQRPGHPARQARAVRPGRPVQLARADRRAPPVLHGRADRPARSVQLARSGRQTPVIRQARSDRRAAPVQTARSAAPVRPTHQARAVPGAAPRRDVRQLRIPAPARFVAATPTRRT